MSEMSDVVRSSRWAAYGDVLGFITELTDTAGLVHRAGATRVERPVAWRRKIGGQFGVEVQLPEGAYSDDTQLRLATSRAIRGDGRFDVEAFAKVELPVWAAYALGAGRSTRAASASLTRHVHTWSTNFFDDKTARYVDAGGNGAAMRVQPHVWAARNRGDLGEYLPDVLRNSLSTHGHPRGFLGAAFHAFVLAYALHEHELPHPRWVQENVSRLQVAAKIVQEDADLRDFWLRKWETEAGTSFAVAVDKTIREIGEMLAVALAVDAGEPVYMYGRICDALGLRNADVRGSGTHTAVAAYFLAWLFKDDPVGAITTAANELGTDTDSIGTMAGAFLGCLTSIDVPGMIQDRDYIDNEARRLDAISQSQRTSSFSYPDLLRWEPPQSQSDAVGLIGGKPVLSGLGFVVERGAEFRRGVKGAKNIWQWMTLDFGQSILAKVREPIPELRPSSAPTRRPNDAAGSLADDGLRQLTLTREGAKDRERETGRPPREKALSEESVAPVRGAMRFWDIQLPPDTHRVADAERRSSRPPLPDTEALAAKIEQSGFKHDLIGKYIARFADIEHGADLGAVFAAAVIRRMRRRR
jgi:ADP-ribosylglycohydrolase